MKNDIKFLELDEYLLTQLKQNKPLHIKGDGDDNMVLCTEDRTFDLKEAEVSNSLLLIPDLERFVKDQEHELDAENRIIIRKDVIQVFNSYVEPKICPPRFGKLHQLLNNSKYKGPEHESEQMTLYSYNELLSKVQASKKEFDDVLIKLKALEIDNKIRIIDFEYHFRVLSYMLDLIQENSWELNEIDKNETIASLEDIVPKLILEKLFNLYTEPSEIIDDNKQFYRYKETDVCRFLAEALLKSTGKLNLMDFMQAWKESVPEGMLADESMLNGLAVIDTETKPNCVWLLYEENLPETITERFRVLFQAKERWTKEQIIPYIE